MLHSLELYGRSDPPGGSSLKGPSDENVLPSVLIKGEHRVILHKHEHAKRYVSVDSYY